MFDVRLMRWIDNQVGNLACSALATAKKISTPFRATSSSEPKRIAVTKFFGMGSIIVASAALRALRDAYPDAEIHFVTFKSNKEILEILGLTDKHWLIDNSSPAEFARTTLAATRGLRELGIDLMLDLEFFAKFPLVFGGLAGIERKAGFYLTQESWRKTLLDVRGSYNHYYHTKDIFLSLVYLITTGDIYYLEFEEFRHKYTYPRVTVDDGARTRVEELLVSRGIGGRRLVLINPNTSPDLAPEVRKWPETHYAELASELLAEHPDTFVAFIGAKSERAYVERIVSKVGGPRCVNLAGEVSLRELLALFDSASLFITNDSGPMHLACLVDTPTIGLFFADSPTVFAPLGTRVVAISPPLYSIPLFTVYNGKDIVAGRPMETIQNKAAQTVAVSRVLTEARTMLADADVPVSAARVH